MQAPAQRPAMVTSGGGGGLPRPIDNILTPPISPAAALLHHNMRHSAVDLFVLTFNCAKTVIDVDVFARHLRGALGQYGVQAHAGGVANLVELPDLVVLCVHRPCCDYVRLAL